MPGGARAPVLAKAAEDHLARRCLQDAGDRYIHIFADHTASIVYDYHRAVVEISHTLVVFLTLFQHEDTHDLARKHDRLQCVGKLVDIEDRYTAKLGDFIQVEVIGDYLGFNLLGQLDQLVVDFAHVGKVSLADYYLVAAAFLFLNPLKYIQSAAATVAFDRVGAIGYLLKLPQHKLGDYQHPREKSCLCNVGDTAINDD